MIAGEAGEPPPHEIDPSSGYGQGRSAPPLHGGVLTADQVGEGSTGYLLRQPTVRAADGETCRLDTLLGRGFAVVGRDEAALAMSPASRRFLDRIGARCLSLEGVDPVENELDRLFESSPCAIVRPDRYVFGVVDDRWTLDRLVASLEQKLAIRAPSLG